MYMDCKLMVLGTRLYMAKEKIGSGLRYARYKAAVKSDKVVSKVKTGVAESTEKVKSGVSENMENVKEFGKEKLKRKPKEESKTEAVDAEAEKVEETPVSEPEQKDVETPKEQVDTETVEKENTEEPKFAKVDDLIYGPNFTPLQGVYYDPDPAVNNFVSSSEHVVTGTLDDEEESQDEARPVTQEDIDIALAKMRGEEVPPKKKEPKKAK